METPRYTPSIKAQTPVHTINEHTISTRIIEIEGKEYKLYDITFYAGTDLEQKVTAAEEALENLIYGCIMEDGCDEELLEIDKMYNYYVPEGITDDDEIIESIGDVVYSADTNIHFM